MVEIKRYAPIHPVLRKLVSCFWINSGVMPALSHKLLPIRNMDLVINLSSRPIVLSDGNADMRMDSCYCTGLMDHFSYSWKRPAGSIELVGISFVPGGFYPFFGIPLSEFRNSIVDVRDLDRAFSARLVERLQEQATLPEKLQALERELGALLDGGLIADRRTRSLVAQFMTAAGSTVDEFCDTHGVHKRKFERFSNRVLGINPKTFLNISRFRNSLHALLDTDYKSLTEVAYDCGYYDQTHFIREFKRFTGSAPAQFLAEKKSVRQISFFS